ncbi:probably acriflavine resistance protein A precursor [gamma proteobacterium HdN1]|nr:probably acriflavine resistance protein A precursor [gamma proteobacterium HdN1]
MEGASRKTAFSALLLSLALAGCGQNAANSADASMPQHPMPKQEVVVTTLQAEDVVLTRELPGRTVASLVAEVRPQVSGIVMQRQFTEGTKVEAGQALYQLADDSYRADLNKAEAGLAAARVVLENARMTASRTARLLAINAISTQANDDAQAALQKAQADVRVAEAAVDSAKVQLSYSRITSPITGFIGKSTVTQGALVTTAQTSALATVQQLDPIYVDLTQPSTEMLQFRKALASGTLEKMKSVPVTLVLEDGTPYEHTGKIAFNEMTVDPSTGSFSLRVEVPNPERLLMPGMYVRGEFGMGVRPGAILVPQRALSRTPQGTASVLVVDATGSVSNRSVSVSQTVGDKWLVESGLNAGDQVVIEGLQKIKPGDDVIVSESVTRTDASQLSQHNAPQGANSTSTPAAG